MSGCNERLVRLGAPSETSMGRESGQRSKARAGVEQPYRPASQLVKNFIRFIPISSRPIQCLYTFIILPKASINIAHVDS